MKNHLYDLYFNSGVGEAQEFNPYLLLLLTFSVKNKALTIYTRR